MYLLENATKPNLLSDKSSSADALSLRHTPLPIESDVNLDEMLARYVRMRLLTSSSI